MQIFKCVYEFLDLVKIRNDYGKIKLYVQYMDNSKCMWIQVLIVNVRVKVYLMKEIIVLIVSLFCVGKSLKNKN